MNGFGEALRGWLDRARKWNPRSWLVGLIIGVLGWQIGFGRAAVGIDTSWWTGLYMAAHHGLQFGTEIVFTYGPLGFLRYPWLFYSGDLSLIPFLYTGAIFFAFCIALVAVSRRRAGLLIAILITLFVVTQARWVETSVAVPLLASLLIVERRPGNRMLLAFALAGGVFAGIELFVKLSHGPVIFAVLLLGLAGARAGGARIAAFVGVTAVSGTGAWLIAGQSLDHLPTFLGNTIQVVAGYSEAMSLYGYPVWYSVLVAAAALACLAWTAWGSYPDRRAQLFTSLIVVVAAFSFYKQAVVRIDRPHIAIFFALAALIWVAVPPRRGFAPVSLVGLVLLTGASMFASGGVNTSSLNLPGNAANMVRETRVAFSPDRQRSTIAVDREAMQSRYFLPPALQSRLEGQRVSVDPWEAAAVWAFEYEWSPVPVFQNYSAYTTELDELNAEAIARPSGPNRVLRHRGLELDHPGNGLDDRFLAWDPPAQAIATLCHFRPVASSLFWQVLVRTPMRCGPEVYSGTVEASFGEEVRVPEPRPNEVVAVRIKGLAPSPVESLRALLYRPRELKAIVDGDTYRLIGATAGNGLMLRMGKDIPEGTGGFIQAPQTSSIAVTGSSGDLEFEFFRFRVRDPGQLRAGLARQMVTTPSP